MEKTCKTCEKIFSTRQIRQKFCSISCGQKSRYSKKKISCKNCKVEFKTCFGTNARLFCGSTCFHKWNSKEKIPFTCQNCSKVIYLLEKVASKKRTCSKECKYDLLGKENSIRFKGKEGKKHASYKNGNTYYKKNAMKSLPNICVCCSEVDVAFDVHHIDGNRKNNVLENLCILCRRCHIRLHKWSIKYSISVEKSLQVCKLTGHLPKVKHYLRIPGSVEAIEVAVQSVLTD